MLSYAQTLGMIASYTRSSLSAEQRDASLSKIPIAVLLPKVLESFAVMVDFAFSSEGVRCLFPMRFETAMGYMMGLPPMVWVAGFFGTVSSLAVMNALTWAVAGLRARCFRSALASLRPPAVVTCRAVFRHWWQQAAPLFTAWSSSGAYVALFFTFLALPVAINQLATVQDCALLKSGGYLRVAPEISCYDEEFQTNIKVPAYGFALLYIAIPALAGWRLIKGDAWGSAALTFLTEGYDTRFPIPRAWECFVLLRKSLLVGLSTGLLPLKDPRAQLTYTMFLCVCASHPLPATYNTHPKPISNTVCAPLWACKYTLRRLCRRSSIWRRPSRWCRSLRSRSRR
jgi:hypothetical protein